jgi:C-terminal processing protease CtpA/Prc
MGGAGDFEEPEAVAERLYRKSKLSESSVSEDSSDETKEDDSQDTEDDLQRTTFELELARPLGLVLKEINGHGVYVESLSPNGSAFAAGVRRGDRIAATGSALGNRMWEKSSLDGILAAVNSGEFYVLG